MDPRLLDVLSAIGSFLVFLILLIGLPFLTGPGLAGVAYLIAIIAFILVMSGTGYLMNEKIT